MIRTYQSLPPKKNTTAFLAWVWMLSRKEHFMNMDEMRYDQKYKRWLFRLTHKYIRDQVKETLIPTDTVLNDEYRILTYAKEKNLL